MWIVIRETEGREWVDVGTLSHDYDGAARKGRELDDKIPQWASANPIARIAPASLQVSL
jgi:hypothetical protein